jgi:hypothetical protein
MTMNMRPFTNNRRDGEHDRQEGESGQIILILALAMVGLLVAAGLATDAGVLFMRKALLDRAVDSAALAGVIELDATINPSAGSDPNMPRAHIRGMQYLAANDIVLTEGDDCPDLDNPFDDNDFWSEPNAHDYCGVRRQGSIPGSVRYAVYVRWSSPLFFMPIIGFDDVPLWASAEAEYMPLVDIYASDTNEIGVIKTSTQAIFGPDICPRFGDPYTPTTNPDGTDNESWDELGGAYTYRISVPPEFFEGGRSQVRVEIFDPDTYNQPAATHDVHRLNGDLLENRTNCNYSNYSTCTIPTGDTANPVWFVTIDENRGRGNVGECWDSGPYDPEMNTRTLYRLYYYKQDTSGNLVPVDLAFYVGKNDYGADANEARATDMHWVAPGATGGELMPAFDGSEESCIFDKLIDMGAVDIGDLVGGYDSFCEVDGGEPHVNTEDCGAFWNNHHGNPWEDPSAYTDSVGCSPDTNGDFIIDFDSEVPDIFEDPSTGVKQLFLQVRGFYGASENSYELWAGPSRTQDASNVLAPSEVNARQVYLQVALAADPDPMILHRSRGVGVFGIGHLPMNSVTGLQIVDIPLTYLGPQFAGQDMVIQLYDPDAGAKDPILFYFDTVPLDEWAACYDDNGASAYATCSSLTPSQTRIGPANIETNGYWTNPAYQFTVPSDADGVPFYGGRLYARYWAGDNDTYGWKITLEGRPFLTQ